MVHVLDVRQRIMKAAAIAILVMLALAAGYFGVAYFVFPSLYPPFYYADFNRAREHLSAVPGVKIIDDWQHHDVTLEDCGFTVRVDDSEPVRIDFYDGQDWTLPFRTLDGVTVSYPYNPRTNDYEEVSFSARQLRDHGVDPTNLGSVLQDIEKLLNLATPKPVPRTENPRGGVWVRIYRDLDRYKQGEQGGADQPTTAPELKSEGKDKPQPESKVAPR